VRFSTAPVSLLVVEDNRSDAEILVEWFADFERPSTIHVARDGHEALAHLRDPTLQRLPDLILLDLNLPRMGGLETLEHLKADAALRVVPVLVLTTSKSSREIVGAYERGAAAVLNKPMRLAGYDELLGSVERFWLSQALLPGAPW